MILATLGFDACDGNGATLTFDIPSNLPSTGSFDNILPGAPGVGSGNAAGKWNSLGTQMFTRIFSARSQWQFGFNLMPFYSEGLGGPLWARDQFFQLSDSAGVIVALELQTDGTIGIIQGGTGNTGSGTLVNHTIQTFPVSAWSGYIEVLVTGFGGSATLTMFLNDVQILTCPILTTGRHPDRFTMGSQNGPPNQPFFGLAFDNVYVGDDQGDAPWNTRLGPIRITTMLPNADASGTWFQTINGTVTPAPIFGSIVDDPDTHGSPDYDYSTISPTALSAAQYFQFQKAPCYGRVLGINVNVCFRAPTQPAFCAVQLLLQGALNVVGTAMSNLNYHHMFQLFIGLSPGTGTYFTDAEIGGAFWGVVTTTPGLLVTQMFLEKIVSLRNVPYSCGQSSYSF